MQLITAVAIGFRSILTQLSMSTQNTANSIVPGFFMLVIASLLLTLASVTNSYLLLFVMNIFRGAAQSVVFVSVSYLLYRKASSLSVFGTVLACESVLTSIAGILAKLTIGLIGMLHIPPIINALLTTLVSIILWYTIMLMVQHMEWNMPEAEESVELMQTLTEEEPTT